MYNPFLWHTPRASIGAHEHHAVSQPVATSFGLDLDAPFLAIAGGTFVLGALGAYYAYKSETPLGYAGAAGLVGVSLLGAFGLVDYFSH